MTHKLFEVLKTENEKEAMKKANVGATEAKKLQQSASLGL